MTRRTLLALLLASLMLAQAPAPAPTHPITGRRIAGVMGMSGAEWLVRPEREAEEKPDAAIEALNLRPGMVVADIGVGVGYMTLRMARKVGPSGRVYGVDIQAPMLDRLRSNAKAAGLANIEPVLSDPIDPKLPEGTIDLALMVDVYHEVAQPQQFIRNVRKALKADGRLVLLEYRAEDPSIPINPDHKMTVAQVRAELEPEGFRLLTPIETLPRQHLLILVKR
jgi:SAM-dependent methyltransferase